MAGDNTPAEVSRSPSQQALYGDPDPRPTQTLPHISNVAAAPPRAHMAPPAFDTVNWFAHNTLQKWRDLHLLKIHHINIVNSLAFLPEQSRKNLYLRLNDIGWPLRLRTLETAGNSAMAAAGIPWFAEDRNALVVLRQFGLSWMSIAQTFFPGHTPQDCMEEVIRMGYNPVTMERAHGSSVAQAPAASSPNPLANLANNAPSGHVPGSSSSQTPAVSAAPISQTLHSTTPSRATDRRSTTHVNHLSSKWTAEEDKTLRDACGKGMNYPTIRAKYLPARTAKALNQRMNKLRHMDNDSKED